jgi:carbon storage regulator
MLILSRLAQEEIVIGDDIIVKVIAIEGKRVRLGIEAKPDIAILRSELINNQQEPFLKAS